MAVAETADLAILALAGSDPGSTEAPSLSVVELSEQLEMGAETFSDRIALLSTLSDMEDEGLVASQLDGDTTVYTLTEQGRTEASRLYDAVSARQIKVCNGSTERITLEEVDEYLPNPAIVRALARLVDGDTLYLEEAVEQEFVGRETECERLRNHLEAVQDGNGRAVVITGPSGVGKTALVEETLKDAGNLLRLSGVFRAEQNEPYGGIKAAIEPVIDDAFRTEDWHPDDRVAFEKRRRELFANIANEILVLAADTPVVLFLDDLQNAATPSIEFCRYLANRIRDQPVLLLTAAPEEPLRVDHPAGDIPDEWASAPDHDHLSIGSYDRDTTGALIETVLGTRRVPASFVDAVYDHTGGNALFVTELVTELIETDALVPELDVYPGDPTTVSATDRLTETIDRRLAGLDEDGLAVLHTAALIGETFSLVWLERACTPTAQRVREYVDILVDTNVFRPQADRVGQFRFTNGLFHETVLAGVPDERRRDLHGRIAKTLAATGGDDPGSLASIAFHYERAGDQRALSAWVEAGDHAASVYANEVALDAYERALDLARATDGADELPIVESIGDVSMLIGEFDRAKRAFEYLHAEADDELTAIRAVRKRASVLTHSGEPKAAIDSLRDSLESAPSESVERCKLLAAMAKVFLLRGDFERARRKTEDCLEAVTDHDLPDLEATVLRRLGKIDGRQGNYEEARAYFERSLAIDRAHDDRLGESHSLNSLGNACWGEGDYEGAAAYFERSLRLSREVGDRSLEQQCLNNVGVVALERAQFEDARPYLEGSLEICQELGNLSEESRSLLNLGDLEYRRGAFDSARETLERCLDRAREGQDQSAEAFGLAYLGRVERETGRFERAAQLLTESETIYADLGQVQYQAKALADLAWVVIERGERGGGGERGERGGGGERGERGGGGERGECGGGDDSVDADQYRLEAQQHLERADKLVDQVDEPKETALVRRIQGRYALVWGETDVARKRAKEAFQLYDDIDLIYERAHSARLLGRIALAENEIDAAQTQCERALETYDSIGAAHDTLETVRLLLEHHERGVDFEPESTREWCALALAVYENAPESTAALHRNWVGAYCEPE